LHAAVDIYSRLNRLDTSIRRILNVLGTLPSVPDASDAVVLAQTFQPHITVKHVSFHYNGAQPVLEGLNLQLEAGEKVALVGVSGSGKSTIAKLISRLYDVEDGTVCVGGIDVRRIQLQSLRTKVCYLMQDPILFDRTLRENLLLGNPNAPEMEMMHALETAELTSLLWRLPDGLNTLIGPRGNTLSGGERQRVALARSILQNPSLLVLDESTSALDVPTERKIFMNLNRHFPDRSIIFISHRIAALTWVDRIVVLNQGIVEAQGTHEELIQKSPTYRYLNSLPNEPLQPPQGMLLRLGEGINHHAGLKTITDEILYPRSEI
jgi:ABC-type multidrug transport system fused ATPase/permease subunit